MKKQIFTLALSTLSLWGFSQTPGYSATGFYEDFGTTEEYSDQNAPDPNLPEGVYWWWKGKNPSDPAETEPCGIAYSMTANRNSTSKKLEITNLNQDAACWQPFGISTKVNLTNDKTYSVSFTNTSTNAVDLTLSFADANKVIINADANDANINKTAIQPNATITLSGTLAGGKHKVWSTVCTPCNNTVNFDYTKVVSMEFTITNTLVDSEWQTLALSNFSGSINSVKLGTTSAANSTQEFTIANYSVYPNPSTGNEITFSANVSNVKVYDSLGKVMLGANNVQRLNISTLSAGIYFINADQGITKLIVQ